MARKLQIAHGGNAQVLEMVSGGTPGQLYDMSADRMTVGRADDNDIVVSSEAVSRYHAVFERDDQGQWCVRDNQSKNGVQVNGNPVDNYRLQAGDVVSVGNFVFRYSEGESAPMPGSDIPEEPQMLGGYAQAPVSAKKKPNKRLIIYTVVGLLLAFLYMQSQDDKGKADKPKETTDQKLARDFKASDLPQLVPKVGEGPQKDLVGLEDPTLKRAEQEMAKLDWTNASLKESEQYFRRGQREYLNKNFSRSIESFQTALTLYRGHELAEKYLRLAVYNAEHEAKKNMEIAIRYFESLQYQRAMYHFNEVIALMIHRPTEPIVKEAGDYMILCKKRLQASELFP